MEVARVGASDHKTCSASLASTLFSHAEEVTHAVSHGIGLIASVVGCAVLVTAAWTRGDVTHVVACCIFGSTLVLLYAASTLYHGVRESKAKRIFARLDHIAIYLLIAGTYTPFALISLGGTRGWMLLAVVWCLAALGIVLESLRNSPSRRTSLALYLVMGWLAGFILEPLVQSLQPEGIALLVLGGLTYTFGVIFYAWQRLPYNHAVWHGFVLAGSAFHFSCVLGYVVP